MNVADLLEGPARACFRYDGHPLLHLHPDDYYEVLLSSMHPIDVGMMVGYPVALDVETRGEWHITDDPLEGAIVYDVDGGFLGRPDYIGKRDSHTT